MTNSKFDINQIDTRLSSLYSSKENKLAHYDRWADNYDSDLLNDLDYVAHLTTSHLFAQLITNRQSRILDVACGTGLVGKSLQDYGYENVDGTDFSSQMIRVSEERGVYNRLFQHDFTTPLMMKEKYDALICVGLFAFTTPGVEHLIHVINAVKEGGLCVITINGAAWRENNLEDAIQRESEKHGFSILSIEQAQYIRSQNIDCQILVITHGNLR